MITTGIIISILAITIGGDCLQIGNSKTCRRDEFDCTRWAKSGKCKTMKSWMEANCCQACQAVEFVQLPQDSICQFVESTCKMWAKQDFCSVGGFKGFMKENCCKTCQDYKTKPTTIPLPTERPQCVDDKKFCGKWAKLGYCKGKYEDFMKKHCCHTCSQLRPKPTTIPLPTEAPKPTEKKGCTDDNEFCEDWKKRGWCTGKYQSFMKKHCCKSCAATRRTTSAPEQTVPPTCIDDNKLCDYWAKIGECERNKDYMKLHCCKACSTIRRTTSSPEQTATRRTTSAPKQTVPPTCIDDNKMCESWARIGECKRNKDYMKRHCCKSCSTKLPCIDDNKECDIWAMLGECSKHKDFMKIHCCKACSKKPACVDDRDLCKEWAKSGACTKNKDFMRIHCCVTCKEKQPESCTDDNEHCKSWAALGECKTNPGFMQLHCKKSCNVC